MRNKVVALFGLLVIAISLTIGCETIPKKTELTIQEVKRTLTLRDPTTVIKGLEARSLGEILILPDDEIDLATAILLICKRAYKDLYKTDIDIHRYRGRIDKMASALLTMMGKEKSPEGIIWEMNRYLFEELKFSSFGTVQDTNPSFLNFVLDEKKGNCLGLSILYLSIAERIGLSLFGVFAPGHAFVRYEDNVKRINIETTNKGKTTIDEFYIEQNKVPKGSQFYLESFGKKQMIGAFLNNVGNAYSRKGLLDQAISDYNKALEINPMDAEAYNNRGNAYSRKDLLDQAISDCNKALEINPRYAAAYYNRGVAYRKKGLYDQAIADYTKVLEINVRSASAYINRAMVYYLKGNYDKSWDDVTKAQELGHQIAPMFIDALRKASGRQQ
jgi:tetratricopeptide (TPR) repeat protein